MDKIIWNEVLGISDREKEDLCFAGYSYIRQGHYDTAMTFFEALSILEPENAYYLQTLGALYLEKKNYLMALNYIEKSLRYSPDHPQALLNRAKALFSLGYKKQAIVQSQKLATHSDETIANSATALLLAYT